MNIPEKIISTLTDEQKKAIENAKTPEELLAIAKETGYELTPEQLEAAAGGDDWRCPKASECPQYCPYLH